MPTTQNMSSSPARADQRGSATINPDNRQSQILSVCFARECGFRPLPWMQRSFSRLLQEGFQYDMLLQVIEQTSHAPRPSWAYLQAIIRRCREESIFTELDFVCLPHRDKDRVYHQNHDFDTIPDDIIDEAIKIFDS